MIVVAVSARIMTGLSGGEILLDGYQRRLWQGMVDLIESYVNNVNGNFYKVVGELQGALDASEIKDKDLINQWYDLWTPLEIRRAIEGHQVDRVKAIEDLIRMKEFLLKQMI